MTDWAGQVVVVAGTDTGVGKTVVTAGLSRALQRNGARVIAVKPIETGCGDVPHDDEDGVKLAVATGQDRPREALVRLRSPVTPALAADRQGLTLDLDALVAEVGALAQSADVVLVEGAGGLLSPFTWERDLRHLASDLEATVLVVAADRLGTLNHVLLTVEALFAMRLSSAGIVLSAPETADASTGTNAVALRRRLHDRHLDRRIAELQRVRGVDEAADLLAEAAGWLLHQPRSGV